MGVLMRMFGNGQGVQNVNGWGTVLQAGAQAFGGYETEQAQNSIAAQMRQNAVAARAVSQRQAVDMRQRGDYIASRARAIAASSGGSTSDPSVVNTVAGIQGESELHALTAMASGENEARGMEAEALARTRMGRAAFTSGLLAGGGTLLTGNASARAKYGWDDSTAGKGWKYQGNLPSEVNP